MSENSELPLIADKETPLGCAFFSFFLAIIAIGLPVLEIIASSHKTGSMTIVAYICAIFSCFLCFLFAVYCIRSIAKNIEYMELGRIIKKKNKYDVLCNKFPLSAKAGDFDLENFENFSEVELNTFERNHAYKKLQNDIKTNLSWNYYFPEWMKAVNFAKGSIDVVTYTIEHLAEFRIFVNNQVESAYRQLEINAPLAINNVVLLAKYPTHFDQISHSNEFLDLNKKLAEFDKLQEQYGYLFFFLFRYDSNSPKYEYYKRRMTELHAKYFESYFSSYSLSNEEKIYISDHKQILYTLAQFIPKRQYPNISAPFYNNDWLSFTYRPYAFPIVLDDSNTKINEIAYKNWIHIYSHSESYFNGIINYYYQNDLSYKGYKGRSDVDIRCENLREHIIDRAPLYSVITFGTNIGVTDNKWSSAPFSIDSFEETYKTYKTYKRPSQYDTNKNILECRHDLLFYTYEDLINLSQKTDKRVTLILIYKVVNKDTIVKQCKNILKMLPNCAIKFHVFALHYVLNDEEIPLALEQEKQRNIEKQKEREAEEKRRHEIELLEKKRAEEKKRQQELRKKREIEEAKIKEKLRIEAENARMQAYMESLRQEQPYYLFFDTECNGLPNNYRALVNDTSNWPRLIQLGWIVTDKDGHVISSHSELVCPDGFTIADDVTRLTGISNQRARTEGKDLKEVLEHFMADLERVQHVVGHNVSFDKNIVGCELYRNAMNYKKLMSMPSTCTMESTADYCKISYNDYYGTWKFPKLQELYNKLFGHDFEGAHNAMADIQATMECFFELKKRGVL